MAQINSKHILWLKTWPILFLLFIYSPSVFAQTKLPVASVTSSGFQDPNLAANTLDGDLRTRWSAEGDSQWIQYDLGAQQTLSQVFIAWYKGDLRIARFVIEISMDAANWTQVFSGSSNGSTLGLQIYDFADLPAQYVRIVGLGNSENKWNSITEVEIHGIDLHPNRLSVVSVTASAFQAPNVPANTLDGDLRTRWSAEGDSQWIQYDFGVPQTIDRVLIAWYKGDLRQAPFHIEVSSDATTWHRTFGGLSSGTTLTLQAYDFDDVMAQYVRIVGHENTENRWNSITEVEIHGASQEPSTRVELIGVVPGTFSTDGGIFELSVIPRDAQGNPIVSRVTKDNFAFRDISVSLEITPEDIVTRGMADVTMVEIIEQTGGENATLVLDFDSSGSMLENDPNRLRVAAGQQLVSLMRPNDQAAIMDFLVSVTPGLRVSRLLQDFTSNKVLLSTAIDQVTEVFNGTPLFDSILDALALLAGTAPASNPAVVVLTDGEDNKSISSPQDVITRAQQQSTSIFTIGLGRGAGFLPLQDIARETGGTFAEGVDADALVRIFQAIGVGIVEGRVVVTGEGRFDPPLANAGTYTVSGTLVTMVDGQSFDTPFSFPVEVEAQGSPPPSLPPPPPPPPPPL